MSNVQFLGTFSSVEHIYNIAFQHSVALIHGSRAVWTKVKKLKIKISTVSAALDHPQATVKLVKIVTLYFQCN
jgi:hypothetical protein